jgi:hypothetical protein
MGHSSISTTLDTYGHLMEGLDAGVAERLEQAAYERLQSWYRLGETRRTAEKPDTTGFPGGR